MAENNAKESMTKFVNWGPDPSGKINVQLGIV